MTTKALGSVGIVLLLCSSAGWAQTPERTPLLLDTDIGTDIEDAFALGLLLASPEVELRGVTTVGDNTQTRALLLCRFLTMTGRRHVAVGAGSGVQPARPLTTQYQYYYHPDVLFNRTRRPEKETAVELLAARLKAAPGKVTLLAHGPLTNLAQLLTEKPESKSAIRRIVLSGSVCAMDVKAAQTVFTSGVPLVVVPADQTSELKLSADNVKKIFAPQTALSLQMQALYQLWDQEAPPLTDVFTAALCIDERFAAFDDQALQVTDKGVVQKGKGKTNARVVTALKKEAFVAWYVERMANCVTPASRPAKFVAQGGLPHRVHVAEDFDNDIERRWWMSGKAETKNLPADSTRACRGVLTHDFDDLLGHSRAMYTAVVFNPVPGPPMGKNTRLSFRYWLKGTNTLRVQIYSLTNGYHRHLVLTGLPQGSWQPGTVDMTMARRPDGTGGPLSEGERIDDIQFYTDPAAELVIDDIVLFDAAPADEKRAFPRHVHFAGVFDTGKQGQEWPGSFEIVPDKGYFWRAAHAVENPASRTPWIRVHLRGERTLGAKTALTFRHLLTGTDSLRVGLENRTTKETAFIELKNLQKGKWEQATVDFTMATPRPKQGERVEEILFLLPKGADLLLDDLILYER